MLYKLFSTWQRTLCFCSIGLFAGLFASNITQNVKNRLRGNFMEESRVVKGVSGLDVGSNQDHHAYCPIGYHDWHESYFKILSLILHITDLLECRFLIVCFRVLENICSLLSSCHSVALVYKNMLLNFWKPLANKAGPSCMETLWLAKNSVQHIKQVWAHVCNSYLVLSHILTCFQ